MSDKKQNLQDTFLNSVRKSKTPLTIFLVNGVKLQGVVSWFDNFCVLLRRDGQSQLVYKHAISTIMVFFSGHGNPTGFYFGKKIDDAKAKNTEIRWGDKELEYIVLDACNVLEENGVFNRWGWPVFKGLHLILGFHTTTSDEADRGRILAQYLNAGNTVRQAWIKACQDTEGSGTQWAYLRADAPGTDTYHDHWWGKGPVSADPDNPNVLYYARGAC